MFSMLLPKDSLNAKLLMSLDCVFWVHVAVFFITVGFFLRDSIFKTKQQRMVEQQQNIQERKEFLERLQDLKNKEDSFKAGQSFLNAGNIKKRDDKKSK